MRGAGHCGQIARPVQQGLARQPGEGRGLHPIRIQPQRGGGCHRQGREFPLQTSAICQALMALAEVAARQGYQRLMITADCGYYALATEAFCQQLRGCLVQPTKLEES